MTADDVARLMRESGLPVTIALHVREAAVARFFDVGVRTVQQWRKDGDGPAWFRMGGGVFYECEAVAEYVNAAKSRSAPRNPR